MKAKTNRWHPVMLPDDYIRKMKRDLAEMERIVESKTRYEPLVPPRPRRATSQSYYEPFPDDAPPPSDDTQSA